VSKSNITGKRLEDTQFIIRSRNSKDTPCNSREKRKKKTLHRKLKI